MLQTHHRGASRAVTTGHNQSQRVTKCPRSPSPSVPRPSQRVANAHGASAPAPPTSHDGSRLLTGPQPQRISPVTTGHNVPPGPQPKRAPPVTPRHKCPQGLSPSFPHPSHNGSQVLASAASSSFQSADPSGVSRRVRFFFFEEDPLCSLPHKASELFPATASMAYC